MPRRVGGAQAWAAKGLVGVLIGAPAATNMALMRREEMGIVMMSSSDETEKMCCALCGDMVRCMV